MGPQWHVIWKWIPAVPANSSASGVLQTKKDLVISESDPDSSFDFQ